MTLTFEDTLAAVGQANEMYYETTLFNHLFNTYADVEIGLVDCDSGKKFLKILAVHLRGLPTSNISLKSVTNVFYLCMVAVFLGYS